MRSRIAAGLGIVLVLALSAGGCSSGGSGGGKKDFDNFVKKQIRNTAEDTTPVEINDTEFRFDEDPDAFADLFE